MKDGLLSKCKQCCKEDSLINRQKNIEKIRAYDRKRGNRQSREYRDNLKEKYPNQYKAQTMVSNAIRDKRLFKEPCERCGENERIHAHHDDYLKPLNVRWLCAIHHHQWHAKNGEAINK